MTAVSQDVLKNIKKMVMKNRKEKLLDQLEVGADSILISNAMKVLGIRFDGKLRWKVHVQDIVYKSKRMFSELKVVRHHLTQDQLLTSGTSQDFGLLYCWMPV